MPISPADGLINDWVDAMNRIAALEDQVKAMRETIGEVLANVKRRKGTDGEGRLSIHDMTIMRAALPKEDKP